MAGGRAHRSLQQLTDWLAWPLLQQDIEMTGYLSDTCLLLLALLIPGLLDKSYPHFTAGLLALIFPGGSSDSLRVQLCPQKTDNKDAWLKTQPEFPSPNGCSPTTPAPHRSMSIGSASRQVTLKR